MPENFNLVENGSSVIIQQDDNTTTYQIWKQSYSEDAAVEKYKEDYAKYTIDESEYNLNNNDIGTVLIVSNNETNKTLRYDYYINIDDDSCYHINEKGEHNQAAIDYILGSL